MAEAHGTLPAGLIGHLVVPERGATIIPPQLWRVLAADPQFDWLLEHGILTKKDQRRGQVMLAGTGYVGRAIIGDVLIDLVEKQPGLLETLLADIHAGAFIPAPLRAPAAPGLTGIAILVHQFLETLRVDVSRELDMVYTNARQTATGIFGGSLDLRRTIALRARGRPDAVAVSRPMLTYATPKNQVIAAALYEIDCLRAFVALEPHDVIALHAYRELFRVVESRDGQVLADHALTVVLELLEDSTRQDRDLLVLAMALLEHVGFAPTGMSAKQLPRARFLKLELLFQEAIRRTLHACYAPTLNTRRAHPSEKPIFSNVTNRYRANPDLVLEMAGSVVAIGDVKYKVWEDRLDQHDLYQLIAHAAAYQAPCAFLVYPHDSWVQSDLGLAPTGCRTWAFGIDIMNMRGGLQAAVAAIGILRSADRIKSS